jgi:hypothetical protein
VATCDILERIDLVGEGGVDVGAEAEATQVLPPVLLLARLPTSHPSCSTVKRLISASRRFQSP